jgi:hypothetical protein
MRDGHVESVISFAHEALLVSVLPMISPLFTLWQAILQARLSVNRCNALLRLKKRTVLH